MAIEAEHYTEFRVHYRYGVNSGVLTGRNVKNMIERHEQLTMGPIGAYKVEEREVVIMRTAWVDSPEKLP